MYCFESKVRYSEVNSKGTITLNAILDYFQDCSFFHSEELKVGLNFLMEKQQEQYQIATLIQEVYWREFPMNA